jgi:mannose-1-phosphate guanylyltransferase
MKIRPVILCGGAGTRLWPDSKKNLPKQFIDFGGWTLFEKTLDRIKNNIYIHPTIVTNTSYLKIIKKLLAKHKFKKYCIILEPIKKNTAAAIALATINNAASLPTIIFPSDHLIENKKKFNDMLKKNIRFICKKKYFNKKDIFIFGIKPKNPSDQYGYFLSRKKPPGTKRISKFIEKPKIFKAKKIIKMGAHWNSGIFFGSVEAFYNSFLKHDPYTWSFCSESIINSKVLGNNKSKTIIKIDKKKFNKVKGNSFDYAILEKYKNVNSIKLNLDWTDLGNWFEILKIFSKKKSQYFKKKNIFYRPWGQYINLFRGKGFLIKELFVKPNGVLSLQKHFHRSERWLVTKGKAKITLDKKIFYKKVNETIEIPKGSVHRIENNSKKSLKIMEAQIGKILKETDIIRYEDVYGRIK